MDARRAAHDDLKGPRMNETAKQDELAETAARFAATAAFPLAVREYTSTRRLPQMGLDRARLLCNAHAATFRGGKLRSLTLRDTSRKGGSP